MFSKASIYEDVKRNPLIPCEVSDSNRGNVPHAMPDDDKRILIEQKLYQSYRSVFKIVIIEVTNQRTIPLGADTFIAH